MHKQHDSRQTTAAAREKTKRLAQATPEKTANDVEQRFVPQTELGRRLWAIRQRIVASGQPPLGWNELERELRERRGDLRAEA